MPAGMRVIVLLMLATVVPPGIAPHAASEQFVLADDLEITLWAESPMLFNPTNIDVDARGRLWVAEAVNYRRFNTGKQSPLTHPNGDRILILEDTDADGKADASKVFVQDPDLRAPLGIAVLDTRIVVSASPHLIVYTDDNQDDVPDRREILLSGFGGFDHDHGLHAVTGGPDGRWYFNAGNAGPHIVTDRSGWTLRAGSLYTGGTPYNLKNHGGMRSDDGRTWAGGLALRIDPDGTRLGVLAHNFRNAYELAVDSFGDLWQNDNDDQVMTCRTTWLMEGSSAGYFSADGTRYWQADRRPGQDTFAAHWHQDDPGVLPAGDNTGAGAPAGVLRYESDLLGARYRGMLLSADAGRNVIFGYHPKPSGAGFVLPRFEFLSSLPAEHTNYIWDRVDEDRRKWFRPSDVAAGPDGALYVADWFDPIVGGHQMRDNRGYGRIYRIAPRGRRLQTPRLDLTTLDGQLAALRSPAVNVRYSGFARLRERGAAALEPVARLLSDPNPFHRARAVWLLAQLGPAGHRRVEALLDDRDPQIRLTALRALRHARGPVLAQAHRLAGDPSPAVRREVALSLRDVRFEDRRDILVKLAASYDGTDRWYLEALGTAAHGAETELFRALMPEIGHRDPLAWDARFADIAWRLHPVDAIDAFEARAGSDRLSMKARQQALVALGFTNAPPAAQAMADLSHSTNRTVAAEAAWWLAYRKTNDWRSYAVDGWLADAPEARARPREALLAERRSVLDGSAPIDARIAAAIAMAGDVAGGRMLIHLAAEKKIAYQLREAIGSVIFGHPDRAVRALASGYFQRPGTQPGTPAFSAAAVLTRAGDAGRGRVRFLTQCATCHRVGSDGADIGPELTAIRSKFDRSGLVEAIVNPSAAIAVGYGAELFVTREDDIHIGFLQTDGPTIAIREASGRVVSIDRPRIAARIALAPSVMPDPLALALNEQDVADIAAFLMNPGRQ